MSGCAVRLFFFFCMRRQCHQILSLSDAANPAVPRTTWLPGPHCSATFDDASLCAWGRPGGCGLGFDLRASTLTGMCLKCQSFSGCVFRPQCPVRRRKMVACYRPFPGVKRKVVQSCSYLPWGDRTGYYYQGLRSSQMRSGFTHNAERCVERFTVTACSKKLVITHNVSLRIRKDLGPSLLHALPAELPMHNRERGDYFCKKTTLKWERSMHVLIALSVTRKMAVCCTSVACPFSDKENGSVLYVC